VKGGAQDLAEARRLLGLAAVQGDAGAQVLLGGMHYSGEGGAQDRAEARRLLGLAAAQGNTGAREVLGSLDKDPEAQQAKKQADANAMMEQLLAEDVEEKKAKGAAKSAKSRKQGRSAENLPLPPVGYRPRT